MGGAGVLNLAHRHPSRFAVVVPVCGYTEPRDEMEVLPVGFVEALKDKPVWAFHSEDDAVVKVGCTDLIVEKLKAAGSGVKYTRYETAPPCVTKSGDLTGHGSYELAFNTPELYVWMQDYRLEKSTGL